MRHERNSVNREPRRSRAADDLTNPGRRGAPQRKTSHPAPPIRSSHRRRGHHNPSRRRRSRADAAGAAKRHQRSFSRIIGIRARCEVGARRRVARAYGPLRASASVARRAGAAGLAVVGNGARSRLSSASPATSVRVPFVRSSLSAIAGARILKAPQDRRKASPPISPRAHRTSVCPRRVAALRVPLPRHRPRRRALPRPPSLRGGRSQPSDRGLDEAHSGRQAPRVGLRRFHEECLFGAQVGRASRGSRAAQPQRRSSSVRRAMTLAGHRPASYAVAVEGARPQIEIGFWPPLRRAREFAIPARSLRRQFCQPTATSDGWGSWPTLRRPPRLRWTALGCVSA